MSSIIGNEESVTLASEAFPPSTHVNNTMCKSAINKIDNAKFQEDGSKCISDTSDNNNTIETNKEVSLTTNGVAGKDNSLISEKCSEGEPFNSLSSPLHINSAVATTSSSNVNSVTVCKEPERIVLTTDQLSNLTKEQLVSKWCLQDKYIASILTKLDRTQSEADELRTIRENEERLKVQLAEAQRKEQYCIMRLGCKENELQELGAQVQELKTLTAGGASLKHSLLDPAINLLFERLKRDLDTAKTKMEETQNELSAWKFTADSNMGKQLMAKCRQLIKENEELGKMISSGRLAKLESDLALQRNYGEDLKKSQSELNEFLLELDEDMEGMQGTILYLQEQLQVLKSSRGSQSQSSPSPVGIKLEPNDSLLDNRPINGDDGECDGVSEPLANGRKRTQSPPSVGDSDIKDAITPPQKRTKPTCDEVDGEENSAEGDVVENGFSVGEGD